MALEGASYDAIAVGTPLIVSDIAVNQDINPEKDESIFFFESRNANSLADKLIIVAEGDLSRPTSHELYARGLRRKKDCGEVLLNVINSTIES